MSKVPHTITRLSQSLGLLSTHQVSSGTLPDLTNISLSLAADLLEYVSSSSTVGGAYGFTVRQSRSNIRRYGINSPIESFAVVPGQITTTLEIKMAALYIQDAMQAFGFSSGNLAFQTRPLIIQEIISAPDIPVDKILPNSRLGDIAKAALKAASQVVGGGSVKLSSLPIIHTYLGCWLSEGSVEYSLEDNQMVIQGMKFDVARIINPNLLQTVAATGVQQLAKSVKLLGPTVSTIIETIT